MEIGESQFPYGLVDRVAEAEAGVICLADRAPVAIARVEGYNMVYVLVSGLEVEKEGSFAMKR